MKELVIIIKDDTKVKLLMEILSLMDFVEVKKKEGSSADKSKKSSGYDFFQSAGLFKNRQIEATELRKKAWKLES